MYAKEKSRPSGLLFLFDMSWLVGLLHHALGDEVFGNLYSVECCTLLDLVTHNPEGETVLVGEILADATHIDGILASEEQGHGVLLLGGVVHEYESIAVGEGFTSLGHADGALGLYPDTLRV